MKHQLFAVFLLISHICPAQLIIEMTIARNENTLTFRQQQAPRPTGDRLVVNKPRNLFIVNNQTLDSGYRVVIVSDANQIPRFSIKIPESEIRSVPILTGCPYLRGPI